MNIRKPTTTLKNGHKPKSIIPLVCLLLSAMFCYSINPKQDADNSITCCYNFILNKLKVIHGISTKRFERQLIDHDYMVTAINNRLNINSKSHGQIHLKSNTRNIDEWSNIIDWKKVKYTLIHNKNADFLISVAPVAGASGLETNFFKYLIVNLSTGQFEILQSLTDDSRFVYRNHEKLELYLFDYSKKFLSERDYDNISLKIDHYRFLDNNLKLLDSQERTCNCSAKR